MSTPSVDSTILIKIKKLMNLSTSSNVHEAALAAARAQELMDRYNIGRAELDDAELNKEIEEEVRDSKSGETVELGASRFNLPRWKSTLLAGIARHNSCKAYVGNRKGPNGVYTKSLELIGRPSDYQTVKYMYLYLSKEIQRLCNEMGKGMGGTWRNNFCVGAAIEICNRIYEMKQETRKAVLRESTNVDRTKTALMRLDKKEEAIGVFLKATGTKFVSMGSSGARDDYSARKAGIDAAKNINLGGSPKGLGSGPKLLN